jgi:hypothetical protein
MSKYTFPRSIDWCCILIWSLVIVCWRSDGVRLIEASQTVDRNSIDNDNNNIQRSAVVEGQNDISKTASYWCDEDHDDYIHALPGYIPITPPSCWYSGYLTYEFLGRTIHTHYTLQIAEFFHSHNDSDVDGYNPLQKPLIYWSS